MLNKKFIKKNRLLIIIIIVLLVFFVFISLSGSKGKDQTKKTITNIEKNQATDVAAGDDAAESLDALTQELHTVVKSNESLQSNNEKLNKKNSEILNNIKEEVEKNINQELHKRGNDNSQKISNLNSELQQVNAQLEKLKKIKLEKKSRDWQYSIDGESKKGTSFDSGVELNGSKLVEVPDLTQPGKKVMADKSSSPGSNLHSGINSTFSASAKNSTIPFYTIPSGATLANSVTMTSLIGRVPVDGVVKSPYPFKIIVGSNNLAANGLRIPNLSGAIIQGITVGDMALSCVRGYVTAITFIFPDGRISTTQIQQSSDSSNLGFGNSLGYLSQPNGNPCFPGKFYTNAPEYLSTMIALGALNQGGQAYSQAQQTSMVNSSGGSTSSLTGSVGKYMLGGAVSGGTSQAMKWFTAREKNSFDAVFVHAGKKAVINITKQININYNKKGRKIYYENVKKPTNNTSLD